MAAGVCDCRGRGETTCVKHRLPLLAGARCFAFRLLEGHARSSRCQLRLAWQSFNPAQPAPASLERWRHVVCYCGTEELLPRARSCAKPHATLLLAHVLSHDARACVLWWGCQECGALWTKTNDLDWTRAPCGWTANCKGVALLQHELQAGDSDELPSAPALLSHQLGVWVERTDTPGIPVHREWAQCDRCQKRVYERERRCSFPPGNCHETNATCVCLRPECECLEAEEISCVYKLGQHTYLLKWDDAATRHSPRRVALQIASNKYVGAGVGASSQHTGFSGAVALPLALQRWSGTWRQAGSCLVS